MNGRRSTETPHYLLLDGLRGIAALMVLGYHLLEAVAFAAGNPEQKMFHGFLAVDFFLILSGFVMGHAYDQRWSKGMSVKTFFRRRLKRLHPMVIMGVMLGLVIFCLQGCQRWDGTVMPWPVIAVGTLLSLLLLPVPSAIELRGNTELFPLNGPHWSLFFEYVFNILYALLLRHLNTKVLSVWVAMAAIALFGYASLRPEGCIAFGWSSEGTNLLGGLLRVGFDYPAGLLLARLFRQQTVKQNPTTTQNTFLWLSIALCVLLCIPSLGMMNPAYELCCVAIAFPAIVWIGAKSTCVSKRATTYRLLGDMY
ncbi:MAG: acyltransferase [Bacteroidales bacterium]|nr:acyltransferase [Bacteroidales bacterium]